jgi:mRNA-degrading endonuclease RelE of RelBE toxin-antitoxin system
MVKRHSRKARYTLWLEPEVHLLRERLPGHIRQRVKRLLAELEQQPKASRSQSLNTTGLDMPPGVEIRRIRLEHWRIIYAYNEDDKWVWVLGIRQRPPYDYEDLPEMISKLSE